MSKKEVFAKKKFGQNFLHDKNIINKIVSLIDIHNKNVVEIGPGRGALTKEIVKKVKNLTAFEIDPDMVKILNEEIKDDNFKLHLEDFLKADLSNIQDALVIANIPYYITSDILFKIFEHRDKFSHAILMVQKEVAERIVAKYRTADYSKLTVSCQFLADTKIEFIVPSKCFIPAPKVDSAIISLKFKDNISNDEWDQYKDFFKLCFSNRRKKLSFALRNKYTNEQINKAYTKMNLTDNIRIQELEVEKIIHLYKKLEEN
ncbi:16S rRNA (adenine(1518)-N(6)/adenine(1519)-N(6))-dimethyltransferase RsmA [Mycoplasmopsis edwardii]|uniref:16S rRNA (Adenine(1518)-N(6)/adenine(1519)-N(6))-dimethyltransferase RsmA n=1 Tax=Mycoplasmopsis edwardii TaxID=53558 RepID=A0ACD4PHA7_9BACT|nr:16S rRNA (adenine(1518)-N(6)/adenine(1519)-N(6))-dimethyltransferase RsmA [Mycoplasmopsis edwardii]WBP84046.1 16S rRNA (adenine(1518)-N(6)/adenine(1519)-N(6))-dimethyltransferase RsmA [Mycoplasmopsis edwardii]